MTEMPMSFPWQPWQFCLDMPTSLTFLMTATSHLRRCYTYLVLLECVYNTSTSTRLSGGSHALMLTTLWWVEFILTYLMIFQKKYSFLASYIFIFYRYVWYTIYNYDSLTCNLYLFIKMCSLELRPL